MDRGRSGVAFAAWVLAALITLCVSPLLLAYRAVIGRLYAECSLRRHKDILVVVSNTAWCEQRMAVIAPLVGSRAVVLNWSERRQWPAGSLATQLFRLNALFGPPPFALERALPVVFVLRRFRSPRVYQFGVGRTRDEIVLAELCNVLARRGTHGLRRSSC